MEDETDDGGDDCEGGEGPEMSEEDKVTLEWLDKCVAVHSYLTFWSDAGIHCLQVLVKRTKVITVRLFDDDFPLGGRWLIQTLDIWRAEEIAVENQELFVHIVEDSSWVLFL